MAATLSTDPTLPVDSGNLANGDTGNALFAGYQLYQANTTGVNVLPATPPVITDASLDVGFAIQTQVTATSPNGWLCPQPPNWGSTVADFDTNCAREDEFITAISFNCGTDGIKFTMSIGLTTLADIGAQSETRYVSVPGGLVTVVGGYNNVCQQTGTCDNDGSSAVWTAPLGCALIAFQTASNPNSNIKSLRFISASVENDLVHAKPQFSQWYGNGTPAQGSCVATFYAWPYFIVGFKYGYNTCGGGDCGVLQFTYIHGRALPAYMATTLSSAKCCAGEYLPGSTELAACGYYGLNPGSQACNTFFIGPNPPGYCASHLDTPECVSYCAQPTVNCDALATQYCTGLGAAAASDPNCACYLPAATYATFFGDLTAQVQKGGGNIPQYPDCYFPACAASPLHTYSHKSGETPCPDIQSCVDVSNVNLSNGQITGPVSIASTTACSQYSLTGGGGSGGGSGCGSGPACVAPQQCVSGACVTPAPATGCGSGPACVSPQQCSGGVCVTLPPGCGSGPACGSGYQCVGGTCVTAPAGCSASSPCPSGQSCSAGACVKTSSMSTTTIILVVLVIFAIVVAIAFAVMRHGKAANGSAVSSPAVSATA